MVLIESFLLTPCHHRYYIVTMAVQLACTFKRVNIKDDQSVQPTSVTARCDTPATSITPTRCSAPTPEEYVPTPEEYVLTAEDKTLLQNLENKRLQRQNKFNHRSQKPFKPVCKGQFTASQQESLNNLHEHIQQLEQQWASNDKKREREMAELEELQLRLQRTLDFQFRLWNADRKKRDTTII